MVASACQSPAEKAASALAGRITPQYNIEFREVKDTVESYRFWTEGKQLVLEGSSVSAMAVGLNRYLNDYCHTTVSWYADDPIDIPEQQPVVAQAVSGKALVSQRFFLNYCTFGYTMPWWQWKDWERFIDWMALQGVNLPLAITGQEAVWQMVWRQFGLTDDEIKAYFTGPAHLPWHRMCNIDGVDGPLPQGWIDGQVQLQKQILRRERSLGMKPVLPAFAGHVPARLKELYPEADITPVSPWGGFPEENRCWFLSPTDSLYKVIQRDFLQEQNRLFGTDHLYGFDLFNEVDAPSWEPETLAAIGREAYSSVASVDPEAQWLQSGWLFYYDRKHWTPEIIEAYLKAVPQGKVTILDYYTEHTPVWELTDRFHGQPYIFCYLGNFGGNTRLAGPFRKESARITDALERGGATGIGCTLEGFGINRWMYEYVLSRAWDSNVSDDEWLSALDRRHHSPEGFWKSMADCIYLRASASEGVLMCDRPCLEGYHSWRVAHRTPYDPAVLERLYSQLLEYGGDSDIWRTDVAEIGCQVLGNRFPALRDRFVAACRAGRKDEARSIGDEMIHLLEKADALAGTRPELRMDRWLKAAEEWATSPEEKAYYRHSAWHLVTTWGISERLDDYANRLWNGLTRDYYLPRWKLFIDRMLAEEPYDDAAFNRDCWEMEQRIVKEAPIVCDSVMTLMTYNVGAFGKYGDSMAGIARIIREEGASLVSFNELDSCNRRHPLFQLAEIAGMLGYEHHFARAIPFADGAYGNGVISRSPILRSYSIPLPQADGAEPRSMAVVETAHCVFASVHLDHVGREAKLQQIGTINNWFSENYSGCSKPVFLCGDFNALPESEAIGLVSQKWELVSGLDFTYSTEHPNKCIDYIFAYKDAAPVRVLSARVLTDGTDTLSDHFPVLLKYTLLQKVDKNSKKKGYLADF